VAAAENDEAERRSGDRRADAALPQDQALNDPAGVRADGHPAPRSYRAEPPD
jgi:hypothetical protein